MHFAFWVCILQCRGPFKQPVCSVNHGNCRRLSPRHRSSDRGKSIQASAGPKPPCRPVVRKIWNLEVCDAGHFIVESPIVTLGLDLQNPFFHWISMGIICLQICYCVLSWVSQIGITLNVCSLYSVPSFGVSVFACLVDVMDYPIFVKAGRI